MGGLNSKQISDIKKGKTDVLVIANQRKDHIQKKLYTLSTTRAWDLSNNFLSSISHRINTLTLTSLNLSSNDFDQLPVQLCSLVSLITLDLSYNFITSIPSEIHQLSSLTSLNLSFNRITELNPDIGRLSSLHTFKISNNYIEKIPDNLSHLRSIKVLSFSHNKITTFPKILWPTIEEFNISSNLIHAVPYPFLIQPSLRVIFISHNKLTSFPPPTSGNNPPSNIKEIYINNNQLTELTTNIYFFPKLEMLDVKANLLKELPFELFVHSPLIRSLDISYNTGCKWGMHMPNAFATSSSIVRDIHISKNQRAEIEKGFLEGMHSDSDTDNEPSSRHYRQKKSSPSSHSHSHSHSPSPLVNDLPAPPSPQLASPTLPAPPSPPTPAMSQQVQENSYTASSSTSMPSLTPRTTTTTITSSVTSEAVVVSPPLSVSNDSGGEIDAAKRRKKKKITFKQVKRYTHNKRRIRVVEHDHAIWEPAVASHASHLAGLAVWSGDPNANVTEEIKKELLQMTRIRPGLFLSYAAQDRETLHANNITHILVVGVELVPAFPTEFEYYMLSVRDNAIVDDLSLHFPTCQKFIDTGRKKGGVLVHCAAGSSRSASCIMAYLMWHEGITFSQARMELKQLRPIVKTNFYLQLEFYEGLLKNQAKRNKAKLAHTPSLSFRPKIIRSTSLPTIDALHTFKLQSSMEDSPPTTTAPPPLNLAKLNLASINDSNTTEKTDSPRIIFSPRATIFSPREGTETVRISPQNAAKNRVLQRGSHSLYSDLRVGMSDMTERMDSPRRTPREPSQQNISLQQPPTPEETTNTSEQVDSTEVEDEIGEGVPDSVIRQASDFEQRSEIHQLMRVHSLQDLMEGVTTQRKLTKTASSKYLKNSKIGLLEESYGDTEAELYREREGEKETKESGDTESSTTTLAEPVQEDKKEAEWPNTSTEISKIVEGGEVASSLGNEDTEGNFRFSPGFSDEVPAGIDDIVDPNDLVIGYVNEEENATVTSNVVVTGEDYRVSTELNISSAVQGFSTISGESNKDSLVGNTEETNGKEIEGTIATTEDDQSSVNLTGSGDVTKLLESVVNPAVERLKRKGLSRSEGYSQPPGFDKGFNEGYEAGFNVGFTAGVNSPGVNSPGVNSPGVNSPPTEENSVGNTNNDSAVVSDDSTHANGGNVP